ncbi:MAG: hypothetical protein KH196_09205 [Oscillospiraceae bacterium]|jgi:hypothetical protein|nr:hypothetical protein [Oscillospiraceae bacterium]
MSRVEFIEKLDALSEEIRLHEPEDIRRVKQRNRPAKKNFGALLFAFLDMEAANPDIYRLICMAQARQGELATLKAIADGVLGWNEGGFEGSYDMYDSAKLMGEARAQLDACGTYEEFAALLKAVHRYLIGLNFQLDNAIPWAELGRTYHEATQPEADV